MSKLTEIMVLLDRSGSMMSARDDHEGGLKSYVEEQKKVKGKVKFTLIQFDDTDPCEVIYDHVNIEDVNEIELIPRGATPLLDSIGKASAHLEKSLKQLSKKPGQVVVMVITDGHENASKEFSNKQIKELVADKEKNQKWQFIYLGANVDAFAEADSMGFRRTTSAGFKNTSKGIKGMYGMSSAKMAQSRGAVQSGCSPDEVLACHTYSSEDRTILEKE